MLHVSRERTLHPHVLRAAVFLGVALLASSPGDASATACPEDGVVLEPKTVEVVVTPPLECIAVDVRTGGCGEVITITIDNDCSLAATVSAQFASSFEDCSEAPCVVPPGESVSLAPDDAEGDVDVTLTIAVGTDPPSEVDVSYSVVQVQSSDSAESGGCRAARGAASTGGVGACALGLLIACAARRAGRSRRGRQSPTRV